MARQRSVARQRAWVALYRATMRGSRSPYAPARLAHSGCPNDIQAALGVFRSDRVALWKVHLRMETLRAVTHARCLATPGGRPFYLGTVGCARRLGSPPDASVLDGGWLPLSVRKPLEGTAVPLSCRSNSLDLQNTSLAIGVTVLLERPKAWSGPPDTCGHDTAKPLEGETTMG